MISGTNSRCLTSNQCFMAQSVFSKVKLHEVEKKKNSNINVISPQIAVDKETLQKKVEFDRPGERSPE